MSASENPCREFFEQHAQNPQKVHILRQTGFAYEWEALSASKHSPSPVKDEEIVVRLILNPIHIDLETGTLKPTAVTDVKDKGCSVDRLRHTSIDDSVNAGRKNAEAKNLSNPGKERRTVCGTAVLNAKEIRNITVNERTKAFCIYDTALELNKSHADVCQVVSDRGQEARSARLQLLQLADTSFQLLG